MNTCNAPERVKALLREGRWPKRPVTAARFHDVAPWLKGFSFEFMQSLDEMEGRQPTNFFVPLASLANSRDPGMWKVGRGQQARELPWLDMDKAMVFGGGAGYGDDLYLVWDFRASGEDPRVVVNRFDHSGVRPRVYWCELTRTFTEFCRLLGLSAQHEISSDMRGRQ